jgi:hypothetical protein
MKKTSLIIITILFLSCQNQKNENQIVTKSCNLSDTLINKIYYGLSKKQFLKCISVDSKKKLLVDNYNLDINYKTWFYHDSLFSLEAELSDSTHISKLDYETTNLLGKIIHGPYKNYSALNNNCAQSIINLFINKYGASDNIKVEAKIGDLIHNENGGRDFQISFNIKKKYEWICDFKKITIEATEGARIYEDSDKNIENILSNKTYQDGNYIEFKILYENLKLKDLYYKESWDKNNVIQEKESKENDERTKKQSEKI